VSIAVNTSTKKLSLDDIISTQLNPEQKRAVLQSTGSVIVLAGAGSGKTRVITTRIAHLIINENIDPSTIVALTFTNKAAHEMKERILQFLGPTPNLPFIGTFHSYSLRWLKMLGNSVSYGPTQIPSNFSILDSDDQQKIIQNIITRNGLKKYITARQAAYHISLMKNSTILGQEVFNIDQVIRSVSTQYEKEKRLSNSLDFDDLIVEFLKLFTTNRLFKERFQQQVHHILVDEYQDTNVVQHELLKEMALDNKHRVASSVCAVGDEDQSIYSWRGATVHNIGSFKNDFPDTATIKIEQNYRSVQQILDVANSVISNNVHRTPKKLWSEKKAQNRVFQISCTSGYQEADAVAWLIQSMPKIVLRSSVAILYRAHYQSRAIEEALLKNSITYKIVGGIQFYERKEIKDLLAYLRLVVNPFDRISLLRVINSPKRGLGEKVEEQLLNIWEQQPLFTYRDTISALISSGQLTSAKETTLREFLELFSGISAQTDPLEAFITMLKRTGYIYSLKEEYDPQEAETRIENVNELHRAIEHFCAQGSKTLLDLLDDIALMQEQISEDTNDANHVQMMTFHAAKGLEFHSVIMVGVEEGILPSSRSTAELDDLEEERRLCYVGMTRAREYLFLFHAGNRNTYGQTNYQDPSRFLNEITPTLLTRHNGAYWKEHDFKSLFGQLFGTRPAPSPVITFGQPKVKPASIHKTVSTSTETKTSPEQSRWKKLQTVSHKKFGLGIIQEIEHKNDDCYVTIKFKTDIKKISDKFIEKI
jgi:DNA helicase-2/ATP-dependent DNA helicase PcrA